MVERLRGKMTGLDGTNHLRTTMLAMVLAALGCSAGGTDVDPAVPVPALK